MNRRLQKRVLSMALAVSMIFSTDVNVLAAGNEQTAVSEEKVIEISSVSDFKKISKNLDGDYILTDDINFKGEQYESIGDNQEPFTGSLNGAGHTISNVNIDAKTADNKDDSIFTGMFGVTDSAEISNLAVENCQIVSDTKNGIYAGVIAGKINNSVIEDVYVDGKIETDEKTAYTLGGIAGAVFQNKDTAKKDLEYNISHTVSDVEIQTDNGANGEKGTIAGHIEDSALVQENYSLREKEEMFGSPLTQKHDCAVLSGQSQTKENSYIGFDFTNKWKITKGGARLKAQEYVEKDNLKEVSTSVPAIKKSENKKEPESSGKKTKGKVSEYQQDDNDKVAVFSSDDLVSGDYTYTLSGGNATVTGYTGTATIITIPGSLDGNVVTAIGSKAFSGSKIASVTLSESIKTIGDSAFYNCEKLSSVSFTEKAANGYTVSIGSSAFSNCGSLSNIKFSTNVTSIGSYAFEGDSEITNITLPSKLSYLGSAAFKGTYISSITIPKTVTNCGSDYNGPFAGASQLKEITFEEGMTKIPDYICASYSYTSYLTKAVIPDTVDTIGDNSFYKCNNLTIYGYKNSYAEEYAIINSIPFVSVAISKNMTAAQILAKLATDKLLNNISLGSATVDGPTVTVGNKTFTLFEIPTSMDIELGDKVQAKVDAEKKTIQVMIGFDEFGGSAKLDSDSNSDTYWRETYKQVKSLYLGVEGKTKGTRDLYNGFRKLRHHLKKFDASMAVKASASAAGYIEFSYASGEIVYSSGGVILQAEMGSSWNYPLACAPAVYVTFGLSTDFNGSLTLVRQDTMNYIPGIDADFALDATLGIGAGTKKAKTYAEIGLNGSLNVNVNYKPGKSLSDTLLLKLKSSMYAKGEVFGYDVYSYTRDFDDVQIYPKQSRMRSKSAIDIDYDLAKAQSIERTKGKIAAFSGDTGNTPNTLYAENNVYKYCAPQLAYLDDGTMLLVWIDDDGSKADANKTSLMYSVFDKGTWSTPAKIGETDGSNDYPCISCDGKKVDIVWQKADKMEEDASLPDLLKTVELYSVTYSDGKMGEAEQITSGNSNYEMMQSVAVNGEKKAVAWIENSENDPFQASGTNTVKMAQYDNGKWTESTVVDGLSNVSNLAVSYSGEKLLLAYETVNDNDGKIVLVQDEKNTEINGTNMEFESGILYYTDDKGLNAYDTFTKAVSMIKEGSFNDVTVLYNGKDKAVVTTVYSGYASELVYYLFDRTTGLWSDAVSLTDEKKYIRDYSAIMDKNGKISAAVNFVTIDEDDVYGDAKLEVRSFADIEDVTVSETAYYDNDALTASGILPLKFNVKNNGTKDIETLKAEIIDESGNVIESKDIKCSLKPGEETEVAYGYTLPVTIKNQTVSVKAYTENEVKLSDNTAKAEIGIADIAMKDIYLSGTKKEAFINGTIDNEGYMTAEDVVVKVYDGGADGTLIGSVNLESINAASTKTFKIAVPEAYMDVNPMVDGNSLYIVAETSSEEADYSNNEDIYMIKSDTGSPLVLDKDSVVLKSGEVAELKLTYSSLANPDTTEVTWKSSDESVAKVENGTITAVSNGTAVITATADGYDAECKVTVSDDVTVIGITLSDASCIIKAGETKQLTATVLPADATNKNVTWKSSDTSVASVSDSGVVSAIASGKTEITATTEDGNRIAVSSVQVYQDADTVYSVKFSGGQGTSGSKPKSLTGTSGTLVTLPDNSYEKAGYEFVGWSDGSNVYEAGAAYRITNADITLTAVWNKIPVVQYLITSEAQEGGSISPAGETKVDENGSQVYTIKADDGYLISDVKVDDVSVGAVESYTFSNVDSDHTIKAFFVKESAIPVTAIVFPKSDITLTKSQTVSLDAKVVPDDATDKQLKWSSSDINVASVVNGVVTAINEGTAVITAEAQDGSGVKAECKVTVTKKQQKISGETKYNKTYGDRGFNLGVNLEEGDGDISYKSSDEKVVSVSSAGRVLIKGAGKAEIIATASETEEYAESTYSIEIDVAKAKQTIEGTQIYSKKMGDKSFLLDAELITGDSELKYISSDKTVVDVSDKGLVSITGTGETVIKITAPETDNYEEVVIEIKVIVEKDSAPQPTETLEPTKTPQSTATAEPTKTPQSTATAEPTKIPQSTATANPTKTPQSTATTEPTQTPQSTATVEPTKTPQSTATAEPTQTPDNGNGSENPAIGSTVKDKTGNYYKITAAGKAEYTKPNNKSVTKVTIPATVTIGSMKYNVTSIAKNTFKNYKKLKSVVIGKKITTIGDYSFYGCKKLSSISIPGKVSKIGKQAFMNCTSLKKIKILTTKLSTKTVGTKAFKNINKKANISVPKKKKTAYKKLLKSKGMPSKAKVV